MNFRPYTTTEFLNDEEVSIVNRAFAVESPGFFIVGGENPTKQINVSLALLNLFEENVDTFEMQRNFFWWTKKAPVTGIFLNDDEESFERGDIYKKPVDETLTMVETLARSVASYQSKNDRTTGYFDTPSFVEGREFRENMTAENKAAEESLWRAIAETEKGNIVFFHYLSNSLNSAEYIIANASVDCCENPRVVGSIRSTPIVRLASNLQEYRAIA